MGQDNFMNNGQDKPIDGISYIKPNQSLGSNSSHIQQTASVDKSQIIDSAKKVESGQSKVKSDFAVDLLTGKQCSESFSKQGIGSTHSHVSTFIPANNNNTFFKKLKEPMNQNLKIFLIAFVGAFLACVLVYLFNTYIGKSVSVQIGGSGAQINAIDTDATLPEQVARKCLPSTVAIDVYTAPKSNFNSTQYDGSNSKSYMGSGIVLSSDGYILTNNHVIANGDKFKVTIAGDTFDATKVGSDPSTDVAVLKVTSNNTFQAIELADSDKINVGEWVMSLGSPFGLEQSVATGIVSATSRSQVISSEIDGSTSIFTNMIQTDSAINRGNSGGPLVNKNGQLIGVNTLIQSTSGDFSGVGFAIPVNLASSIAKQIIEGKTPTHAFLGANFTNVTSSSAKQYGFAVDSGAYVSSVIPGSAAEKAGLQKGDILVEFDGQKIASTSDVLIDVRKKNPGDQVTLRINRNGQELTLDAYLGSDENAQINNTQDNKNNSNSNSKVQNLEDFLRKYFGQ